MTTADLSVLAFNDEFLQRISTLAPLSFVAVWFCVVAIWFVVTVLFTCAGWPETKVANGSLWWLIWISSLLAVVVDLPAVVLAVFLTCGQASTDQFWIATGAVGLGAVFTSLYLRPPIRVAGSQQLPLVTDEKLLDRIEELATKMNVPIPVVRLLPSMGPQKLQAFAGTIHAPQLLLTDGILHRLEPAERDAIIAHELGHIANHSLWIYALRFPVCCTCTVAVATLFPTQVAVAFGLALFVGLKRICSRPLEFDCDRRAATTVGYQVTASALAKIHAIHPIKNGGLLSQLVYATASHPSRDARLAALLDAAPTDDRPDPTTNIEAAQTSGRLAYFALVIWATVLMAVLVIGFRGDATKALIVPLLATALMPVVLLMLAIRKQAVIARHRYQLARRQRTKVLIGIGLGAFALTFATIPVLFAVGMKEAVSIPATILSVVTIGWFVIRSSQSEKPRQLLQQVATAMQLHNFRHALSLCAAHPAVVSVSHLLRYNQAICHEVCGDRATAIAALERLWMDKPLFPLTALALSELLLDSNELERAIVVARSVAPLLSKDPIIPLLEGRILRRWGKLSEAQEACDRAMAFEPDSGGITALAAALELDRGRLESARTLIQKALELAPGEPYLLVSKAEIDLASDAPDQWQSSVDRATELIQSNPYSFLHAEVVRLKELLAAKRIGVTDEKQVAAAPVEVDADYPNE